MVDNAYAVADGSDALIVATEWNEFKNLDLESIKSSMKQPVIFDGRNIYDPEKMHLNGFTYHGMGRGYNGNGRDGMTIQERDVETA